MHRAPDEHTNGVSEVHLVSVAPNEVLTPLLRRQLVSEWVTQWQPTEVPFGSVRPSVR
ncbi:hypothetical protein MB901379_02778 [Mycobacterium basiliense]|uniref:Uncharacterized protein n=1 Tax=Mycobacterium basiliense TaxID=2094119 RepID=A0A447GFP0_9MYCO|nr:hypothetical protein MB901379_02778 [Mycobacterium basiliense]